MEINEQEIFKRMDIQQIRNFILDGLDSMEIYKCTCGERLKKGNAFIINRLKTIYRDENEFSDAVDDFYNALVINSEIYTEIGMKAGARLLLQLICKDNF